MLRHNASHFDNTDLGEAFCCLNDVDVSNGSPFNAYMWSFHVLVSSVSGSEHARAPTTSAVLDSVPTGVSNQYAMLVPVLFPGHLATQRDP